MRLTVVYSAILFHIAAAVHAQQTLRVSVASDGTEADGPSGRVAISRSCRTVAFFSEASNLVEGDTNGVGDIFLHSPSTGSTIRVSVDSNVNQANDVSRNPAILDSAVAFMSLATNLVPGDTNEVADVFLHHGAWNTERVSVASDGTEGNAASGSGGISVVSSDDYLVAFISSASNLVPGDTNAVADVFVHDLSWRITSRVSVSAEGVQANGRSRGCVLSEDGRFVTFSSLASNLIAGDTNGQEDVFVHDRQSGETTRVSTGSGGKQSLHGPSYEPDISSAGRFVTFTSLADNLVIDDTNDAADIFVHDRQSGQTLRASIDDQGAEANGDSERPRLSGDGLVVVFRSGADNLVPDDTNSAHDIFLRYWLQGRTHRISLAHDGSEANGSSGQAAICLDGAVVGFDSMASNLVAGDLNSTMDVFLRERYLFGDGFESGDLRAWSVGPQPPPTPSADFVFSVQERTVHFFNTSVGAQPLTFVWEFGDGGVSTAWNPVHTYASPGDYSVRLTATNAYGVDDVTKLVTVEP